MMRLQWRQGVRLRHRVLRLHGILRHRHAGQRRRTLRQSRRRRSRRVRTRVHGVQFGKQGCAGWTGDEIEASRVREVRLRQSSIAPSRSSSRFHDASRTGRGVDGSLSQPNASMTRSPDRTRCFAREGATTECRAQDLDSTDTLEDGDSGRKNVRSRSGQLRIPHDHPPEKRVVWELLFIRRPVK